MPLARTHVGAVIAIVVASFAAAGNPATASAASCSYTQSTQLFAPWQDYSAYAAAIPGNSTDAAAARAFIAALTSAATAERWRANGFEPPK